MKFIYNSIFIAALLMAGGCKKELYKDPIGLIPTDQVTAEPTVNTVTSSVASAYKLLSSRLNLIGSTTWDWNGGTVIRPDFVLQDMASGDLQKKWDANGEQPWMDEIINFNFTASNAALIGIWSFDFDGIARSNRAIASLTNTELMTKIGMDETTRKNFLGEVYFLRSFYYFDLVNNFGSVPLITIPIANFQDAYKVSVTVPKAQILTQITGDLATAKGLLPAAKFSSTTEKWKVSKGAVIALQAKIALYNEQWTDVISLVTELETTGYYSLDANYFDNFDVTKEFADNEVIFAYNHISGQLPANGNGIAALLDWGFLAPTTDFINAFEPNDPRLEYTVSVSSRNVNKLLGTLNGTYKGNDDAPSNKILIRMADVLLWKAEAYNETGNYAQAVAIINQIRTRARNSLTITGGTAPAGTLPDRTASTDKAQIKTWLMQERRVELGYESQRFNDLKRWKLAKTVLTAAGKDFKDNNYLYAVPQTEIDKSAGTITQNPGY